MNIYNRGNHPHDAFQSPNGIYMLNAMFYIAEYPETHNSQEIYISFPIRVVNSWELMQPEEARMKALSVPDVQRWLQAHTGEGVVKKANGQAFVNIEGWKITDQGGYERALSTTPDFRFYLNKGHWLLNITSQYGPSPMTIGVRVDYQTGEVLDVFPLVDGT